MSLVVSSKGQKGNARSLEFPFTCMASELLYKACPSCSNKPSRGLLPNTNMGGVVEFQYKNVRLA